LPVISPKGPFGLFERAFFCKFEYQLKPLKPFPIMATSTLKKVDGKEITLPSGSTAVIADFKGKHIRQATEMAGDDSGKIIFAMIAICCTIDGEPVVMEDLDEMAGKDVLALQKEFSDLNF
jgi:hypothetical protein